MRSLLPIAAAGLAVGIVLTLSPMTLPALAVMGVVLWRVGRTLPLDERWWFVRVFAAAILLRLAAIAALFLTGPLYAQGTAFLFGDEAYALTRSWRMRNVLLGLPQLKYDYIIAFEDYGRSSYLDAMTYLQVLAGSAPYGLRVLNAALYVGAVAVLFRMARRGLGAFTAFAGAVVLLFLPTLFFWSISLLKEPFYLVLTAATLAAVVELLSATTWRRRAAAIAVLAVSLFGLRDLRTGAIALALSGIGLGLATSYVLVRPWRIVAASAAVVAGISAVLFVAPLQQRATAAVTEAADTHAGHVFTVGHSYQLLDESYYVVPRPHVASEGGSSLRPGEAARYVARALVAYVVVPLPWQITTRGELAYWPEQLIWYLLIILAPVGVVEASRRDRVLGPLLIAYVLPTAAVVAITSGNVGTLIRHRTLILPLLIWISALGFAVVMQRLAQQRTT